MPKPLREVFTGGHAHLNPSPWTHACPVLPDAQQRAAEARRREREAAAEAERRRLAPPVPEPAPAPARERSPVPAPAQEFAVPAPRPAKGAAAASKGACHVCQASGGCCRVHQHRLGNEGTAAPDTHAYIGLQGLRP